MFEDITVEKNVAFRTVTVTETGNPFTVKAILGEEDGQFKGASFIEVKKSGVDFPGTGIHCGQYGVVHSMEPGADADKLTAVCRKLNTSIEESYGMQFDPIPEPAISEEPTPPAESAEEEEVNDKESEETEE